jgi:hypothetical protein
MAFKTFAPGVLTSSDINTFFMRQAVIVCTSSTRPASPNEGMTIYETDTKLLRVYSGTAWEVLSAYGAWTTFTPVVHNWTLGNGTHNCSFMRVGRLVVADFNITWGSTSTFAGALELNVPVNSVAVFQANRLHALGVVRGYDDSTATPYLGTAARVSQSRWAPSSVATSGVYGTPDSWNQTVPVTWAQNDSLQATFTYQAAS